MRFASSLVAIACVSCSTNAPRAPETATATTTVTSAELTRERDDALRRAAAAETVSTSTRRQCEQTSHDLDKLRERDNFEQSIWIRLNQADLSVHSLGDLLPQLAHEQRKTVERAIHEALPLRGAVEQQLRRLHSVPDEEWPQYERDLDRAMDDLERALHPLL